MRRITAFVALAMMFVLAARAGGPSYVAGTSGFNAGLAGTSLRWAGSEILYYTDQGNLSALEQQGSINALVADAFSRWTSVLTVALKATRAGSLDEDVSGANVTLAGTTLTIPADIQPDSAKPIAFVYDADGKVTDALLGAGASQVCSSNMVFGGADRFTPDGHIAHALIILNGACAQSAADIPVLRYQLIRAIGRALGLGWSQANDTVETNRPDSPTSDELAGYPLMHPEGGLCAAGAGCYANSDQLRMDDRMAISRLYPVTPDNAAGFPGKKIFAATTARVRGSVLFGWPQAPIQGVNVVARLIDPVTNLPSARTVAASVSGFLCRGNAGNVVTGYTDSTGQPYSHWGAEDEALRGYFELAGLEIPAGQSSAKYQITVEPVNANYTGALTVGPFTDAQVTPPGTAAPVVVTVTAGGDIMQNIVLQGPAFDAGDPYEPHSFHEPSAVPGGGTWAALLDPASDVDWHALQLRGGHSFTVDVTALDGAQPIATKALPVIGIWNAEAAADDAPVLAQTYFNAGQTGVTRLQGSLPTGAYKLAIAEARGMGRPDFLYRARILYADGVAPEHAVPGTVLSISGLGFSQNLHVTVGSAEAPLLSFLSGNLMVAAPTLPDGAYDLTISDSISGASATISNAVRYGGARDDTLQLLEGGNPPVPVGTTAPNPFRVRVLASDGVTPVHQASVRFISQSASVLLLPCNTRDCTVASDGAGEAEVWMIVNAASPTVITASLAGGATVSATVSGTVAPLSVVAAPAKMYLARDRAASVPLLARVAGNGAPLAGKVVEFAAMLGEASLSAGTATTGANGEARVTLTVPSMQSEIRVSACAGEPPLTACDIFYLYAVPAGSGTQLVKAGGDAQYARPDGFFQPVVVRVNDLNDPPNGVAGMPVTFHMTAYKPADSSRTVQGEVVSGHYASKVAVASEKVTLYSDAWGLARYTPPVSGAGVTVVVRASSGTAGAEFTLYTWEWGSPALTVTPGNTRHVDRQD